MKVNKVCIKIVIMMISFCQGLQFVISPVLNQIQEAYPSVSVSLVQMLITVPALLSMVCALVSGQLVTKISIKKLLLIGSLVAGGAGFLPFLNGSFEMLLFSRALYGVGLGLATALNTAVVAQFFEGQERVSAMGWQSACVGLGMLLSTTLGGILGANSYRNSLFVHLLGILAFVVIAALLPDTGKAAAEKKEKVQLNREVLKVDIFTALEYIFLIAFSTNIAMHIGGSLAGNSSVSGALTGIFSGIQIVAGFVLVYVVKLAGKYTLPAAMLSFSLGAVVLMFFPSTYVMLIIGAVLCGLSQGIFVPQAMCEATNAVNPTSAAMASATVAAASCLAQLVSPIVLNNLSKAVFSDVSTTHVFALSAVLMAASAVFAIIVKKKQIS